MQTFTKEQSDRIMRHIETMMQTEQFDFVLYILNHESVRNRSDYNSLSNYIVDPYNKNNVFENYIKFENMDDLNEFIHINYDNTNDFINKLYKINPPCDTKQVETMIAYLTQKYPKNMQYSNIENHLNNEHIMFHNFIFKNYKMLGHFTHDTNEKFSFITDTTTEYQNKQYFVMRTFCVNEKVEGTIWNKFLNFVHGNTEFNSIDAQLNDYEIALPYMLEKLNIHKTIKFGRDNRFIKELKNVIAKMITATTNKKVIYDLSLLNLEFKYESTNGYNYSSLNRDTQKEILEQVYKELNVNPDTNMLTGFYKCRVRIPFEKTITPQVKKSMKETVRNYLINNNIKPISWRLDDNGRVTYPARAIEFEFACSDFKAIGVETIKFMIPKLGMKRA